jgi:hypothetical protein
MNELPEFPVIEIANRGSVAGYKAVAELCRHSLFGICHWKKFNARYFDAKGMVWSAHVVNAPYPVNIWTKILSQIYNPWFTIEFTWRGEGNYNFSELQEKLRKCVDMDDDIMTQFMEADDVKALIKEAQSFEELFAKMKNNRII